MSSTGRQLVRERRGAGAGAGPPRPHPATEPSSQCSRSLWLSNSPPSLSEAQAGASLWTLLPLQWSTQEMIPAVSADGPGRPDLRNLGGGLNTSTEGPAASQGSGRVALRALRELEAAVHTCGLSVKQEPRDSDRKPFHHPGFIGTPPRDRRGLQELLPASPLFVRSRCQSSGHRSPGASSQEVSEGRSPGRLPPVRIPGHSCTFL